MIRFKETAVRLALRGTPGEMDQLEDAFLVRPNGYMYSPRYEEYRLTQGKSGWDGYLRPLRRISAEEGSILRGRRDEVLARCEEYGFEMDLSGLLPRPYDELTLADIPDDLISGDFALDEYQRTAVLTWLRAAIGINQATVSAGKTAMFAGVASMIKRQYPTARFLYLTPAERLVRQSSKEMKKFLPHFDIGQFGGGKDEMDAKDMVICTVAMLTRHFKDLSATGWWRTFMAILFDEAHHCTSPSAEKILLQIPAYFRLGASDSIKVNDPAKQAQMKGLLGGILGRVRADPLIKSGRLAKPHIYVESMADQYGRFDDLPFHAEPNTPAHCLVESDWVKGTYVGPVYERDEDGNIKMRKRTEMRDNGFGKLEKVTYEEPITRSGLHTIKIDGETYEVESRWCLLKRVYDQAIVLYKERNEKIVEWAAHYSSRGLPTLVVCTRTLHIYVLEALIGKKVDPKLVRICYGWATSKQRDEAFEWFKTSKGGVLITPLVKEGVSINEIRAGVVADYVGDIETANQIVGRFMRRKDVNNWAEITWFADDQHRSLRRGSRQVINAMETQYKYPVFDPAPRFDQLVLDLSAE
jgi:superfamily II DNA or RNA helicase